MLEKYFCWALNSWSELLCEVQITSCEMQGVNQVTICLVKNLISFVFIQHHFFLTHCSAWIFKHTKILQLYEFNINITTKTHTLLIKWTNNRGFFPLLSTLLLPFVYPSYMKNNLAVKLRAGSTNFSLPAKCRVYPCNCTDNIFFGRFRNSYICHRLSM